MDERQKEFQRNTYLEELLQDINADLYSVEKNYSMQFKMEYPIIFIVGPFRSGSTVTMQWLANTKVFSYPSNILSRFYRAPIIGAKIQMLLTDPKYNFRNEILDFNRKIDFCSENGKTQGALAPNEFWYFWRNYLPFQDTDILSNKELEQFEGKDIFRNELMGIAGIFQKPLALKAIICNYNISFLNKLFPKALFIYTVREVSSNIASVLEARKRQMGSIEKWYSFKIPEYDLLKNVKEPKEQVAGQIYFIKKAVESELACVPEEKKLIMHYEDFCVNPKKYFELIKSKLALQDYVVKDSYIGPEYFCVTRPEIDEELLSYYRKWEAGE